MTETQPPTPDDIAALVEELRSPRHDLIDPHADRTMRHAARIPVLIEERRRAADALEALSVHIEELRTALGDALDEIWLLRKANLPDDEMHRTDVETLTVPGWLAGHRAALADDGGEE